MEEPAVALEPHRAHPALRGLVAGIVGMRERAPGEVRRRQPAGTLLPLVLSWGAPLTVSAPTGGPSTHAAFVAGLMPGPADTSFRGVRDCVHVYLTPLGAQRVLGVPGLVLAGRVAALGDVVPTLGDAFCDRLGSTATWAERFSLVERVLVARLGPAPEPDPLVPWMWDRITATGGRARIRELAERSGWSQRHVTERFTDAVGVTPKAAAQVVRFERALADLDRVPLAQVATDHGYADQSHLTREFGRYAGGSPGELAAAAVPTAHSALRLAAGGARHAG